MYHFAIICLTNNSSEVIHINNTLNLLGFKEVDVDKIEVDESDLVIIVHIWLKKVPVECPYCKEFDERLHSYRKIIINHNHFIGKKCFLYFYRRRLKCMNCHKTYLEPNPFSNLKKKISDETIFFILDELKQNQSFTSVAKKAGISTTEVVRIFDKHVDMPRLKLPKILGIDEFKNLSSGRGKYACILTSINNSDVVDVLEDRTIETLSRYFSTISREERQKVNYFVSDMYDGYKYIHDLYFPNSIHIIDTFHFVRLFTDAFNRIRIRIMKSYPLDSFEYDVFKKYWKTLMMPYYKLHTDKTFYKTFNRELNQKDLLNIILRISDDLYHAYMIKEDFVCNYYKVKYEKAEAYLDKLIVRMKESNYSEYKDVANSLIKWKEQLINSFIRDNKGKRITNARTEGFNNAVKVIKRTSYGYAKFSRFRNRILYILRKIKPIKI